MTLKTIKSYTKSRGIYRITEGMDTWIQNILYIAISARYDQLRKVVIWIRRKK